MRHTLTNLHQWANLIHQIVTVYPKPLLLENNTHQADRTVQQNIRAACDLLYYHPELWPSDKPALDFNAFQRVWNLVTVNVIAERQLGIQPRKRARSERPVNLPMFKTAPQLDPPVMFRAADLVAPVKHDELVVPLGYVEIIVPESPIQTVDDFLAMVRTAWADPATTYPTTLTFQFPLNMHPEPYITQLEGECPGLGIIFKPPYTFQLI